MIKLFKILLDSWKIIINGYREIFFSELIKVVEYSEEYDKQNDILQKINTQTGGKSNTATLETVKKARECLNKINPGEMILTKQNQADIFVYAMDIYACRTSSDYSGEKKFYGEKSTP